MWLFHYIAQWTRTFRCILKEYVQNCHGRYMLAIIFLPSVMVWLIFFNKFVAVKCGFGNRSAQEATSKSTPYASSTSASVWSRHETVGSQTETPVILGCRSQIYTPACSRLCRDFFVHIVTSWGGSVQVYHARVAPGRFLSLTVAPCMRGMPRQRPTVFMKISLKTLFSYISPWRFF